jgi:RHS repeat-associated protein
VAPSGSASYYLSDQVDSVTVVLDDGGKIVTQHEYLPFGEDWITEGDTKNAPKYNSQELDKETGFYFYNARHYDPEICRFVTADTVIDGELSTQGWNRFSYVHNNPIRYKEPTGHDKNENYNDASKVWKDAYNTVNSNKNLNTEEKSRLFDDMVSKRLEIPQRNYGQKNCIATSKAIAMMAEGVLKNKNEVNFSADSYMDKLEKALYPGITERQSESRTSYSRAARNFNQFKSSSLQTDSQRSKYEYDNTELIEKANKSELGNKTGDKYTFKSINSNQAFKELNKGKVIAGYSPGSSDHATAYYLNPFSQEIKSIDPLGGGNTYRASLNEQQDFKNNTRGYFEKLEKMK